MHTQYALRFVTDSIFVTGMSAVERAVITGRLAATMSPAALYSLQFIYNAAKPGTSTALVINTNYHTNCKVTCKGNAVSELDVRNLNIVIDGTSRPYTWVCYHTNPLPYFLQCSLKQTTAFPADNVGQ